MGAKADRRHGRVGLVRPGPLGAEAVDQRQGSRPARGGRPRAAERRDPWGRAPRIRGFSDGERLGPHGLRAAISAF